MSEQSVPRDPVADASGEAFNNTFHKCAAEISRDQWDRVWHKAVVWARANPVTGAPEVKPPCTVCGTPHEKHGSYPSCASHPYTPDATCQHVGVLVGGRFVGATCVGMGCVNGCARAAAEIGRTQEAAHG